MEDGVSGRIFTQGGTDNFCNRRFVSLWFSVYSGLLRAFSASAFCKRREGDGGDEGHVVVNLGVAFGEGADCGQVVFLELVGQKAEPPAEDHHMSGRECEQPSVP